MRGHTHTHTQTHKHTHTHTHTQSPPLLTRSRGEYLRVVGMPVMVEQIGRYL